MYRTYNARPVPQNKKPQKGRKKGIAIFAVITVLLTSYVSYALLRPLPELKTVVTPPVVTGQFKVNIPWPAAGQAAFGADGYGLLATTSPSPGLQKPMPTASVTKVITAMAILKKHPLQKGEQGPTITMTERDNQRYFEYMAKDGVVVPVVAGQKITQYQAMQALLIPSANNIADTLVVWAFGSMEAYLVYANDMVTKLGLTQTTVSDASGFSPQTVSTPADLVRLGDIALDHPVLAEITSQKQAEFPGYGTMNNVNNLLGQSGIRGIKTGTTDEAGGCYLAAADVVVGGEKITVITAVMGSTNRPQAMKDSVPIINSSVSQFQKVHIVREGQVVGRVTSEWGATSDILASQDLSVLTWNGKAVSSKVKSKTLQSPAGSSSTVGHLTVNHLGKSYTSELQTERPVGNPSIWWRLSNPI